jgi:hypothetical protein
MRGPRESMTRKSVVDLRSNTGQLVAALQQRQEMRLIPGGFETNTVDFGFDRAKIGLASGIRALTSPNRECLTTGFGRENGESLKTIFLVC